LAITNPPCSAVCLR